MGHANFKGRHEAVHELLYRAHWLLLASAETLHKASVVCRDAARGIQAKDELRDLMQQLEDAEICTDDARRSVDNTLSALIKLTGCDGKCSDRARAPEEKATNK